MLAEQGYETYIAGKLHYLPYAAPDEPRLTHGFQHVKLCESGRILSKFDPKAEKRGVEDYIDYLADVGWAGYSRADAKSLILLLIRPILGIACTTHAPCRCRKVILIC